MDENVAASLAASLGAPDLEHVVFFTSAAGSDEAERFPSLTTAVRRVEVLCNDEDVRDAVVFALTPVPLSKRQRWHVEAGVDAGGAAPPAPAPSPVATLASVPPLAGLAAARSPMPPPPPAPSVGAGTLSGEPVLPPYEPPPVRPALTAVAAPQTFVPSEVPADQAALPAVPASEFDRDGEPEPMSLPAAPTPRRGLGLFAH